MIHVPRKLVSDDQRLMQFDVVITMSSGSKAHIGKNALYYSDDKMSLRSFRSKISISSAVRFYGFYATPISGI